jgi:hypothetical protein
MKSSSQRRAELDRKIAAARLLPTIEERVDAAERIRRNYADVLGRPCQQNRNRRVQKLKERGV